MSDNLKQIKALPPLWAQWSKPDIVWISRGRTKLGAAWLEPEKKIRMQIIPKSLWLNKNFVQTCHTRLLHVRTHLGPVQSTMWITTVTNRLERMRWQVCQGGVWTSTQGDSVKDFYSFQIFHQFWRKPYFAPLAPFFSPIVSSFPSTGSVSLTSSAWTVCLFVVIGTTWGTYNYRVLKNAKCKDKSTLLLETK